MTEPLDDELAAMLEARADRVRPGAGRDILAAVRDETRAPTTGAGFALLPVARSRGVTGWAGPSAIGLLAVLVLAVVGGRLGTAPAQPPVGAASGGPTASPAAASAAPAATSAVASAARSPGILAMTADQLRTGLAAGTLEGRTVVATGRLRMQPWPCPSPMPDDCYGLQLQGVDGVEVVHAGLMTLDEANARINGDTTDRPMAFRATGGRLSLLGWISAGAATPLTVHELVSLPSTNGRADLAAVGGWLLGGHASAASCPGSDAQRCSEAGPVLADASPRPDGMPTAGDATEVTIDGSLGLVPEPVAIGGPFLVRRQASCGGGVPACQVVARYDAGSVVRVDLP